MDKSSGTLVNAPVAFDYSHDYHRSMQAVMWSRILKVTDALIGLLKQHAPAPAAFDTARRRLSRISEGTSPRRGAQARW
jgi:hypothetical protein